MRAYSPRGDLYFERALKFTQSLLARWRAAECTHAVSVVFFSRAFHNDSFTDYYNVICDELVDWSTIKQDLKAGFAMYPTQHAMDGCSNSCAREGNLLQAINLAVDACMTHRVDRCFARCVAGAWVLENG